MADLDLPALLALAKDRACECKANSGCYHARMSDAVIALVDEVQRKVGVCVHQNCYHCGIRRLGGKP